ncbi:hypothetical protein BpHYR1_045214 [Brachionus plicatilis]|uniref:Integrase zinc-binding domain-containing protein n=1 Tax=Brachionus plicatilis TaxID=10195 RepID=A0A3M7PSB6_BRAPC|nr:hypothetical protein BpHYR1_045214 [Brachionus plicatilis]
MIIVENLVNEMILSVDDLNKFRSPRRLVNALKKWTSSTLCKLEPGKFKNPNKKLTQMKSKIETTQKETNDILKINDDSKITGKRRTTREREEKDRGKEGDLSNLNTDENIEWIKKVIESEIGHQEIEVQKLNDEQADLLKQSKNLKVHKNQLWRVIENDNDQILQLVVPEADRRKIIEFNHSLILCGHFKFEKTIARIKRKFYWPKMNIVLQNSLRSA